MNAITFDTHAAANRLGDAGFTREQVEALVDITRQTTALPDVSTLATKADMAEMNLATKADFAQMRSETKADFAEVRLEIASAKVQVITIMLSAMAVCTAVGAFAGKLIR